MANDIAHAILEELPQSAVSLVIYRDYNHEEGFAVRKSNNGFYFKHFGGDRHNMHVNMCDANETYSSPIENAVNHLWALVNMLNRPRGLELVYVPNRRDLKTISQAPTIWRIGMAASEKESFVTQMTLLFETLDYVKMK